MTVLMGLLRGSGLNEAMETELLKAPMTIMNWDTCFREFPKLTKNMLCAGYENESYDSCQVTWGYLGWYSASPGVASAKGKQTVRVWGKCGNQKLTSSGCKDGRGSSWECSLEEPI